MGKAKLKAHCDDCREEEHSMCEDLYWLDKEEIWDCCCGYFIMTYFAGFDRGTKMRKEDFGEIENIPRRLL